MRRGLALAVGLFIVLFNITATYLLPSDRVQTVEAGVAISQATGERIVICTAFGATTVNADGTPLSQNGGMPGAPHGGLCAFCLPLMTGALAPPVGPIEPPVFFAEASKPAVPHQVTGRSFDTAPLNARPRAPPQTTPSSV